MSPNILLSLTQKYWKHLLLIALILSVLATWYSDHKDMVNTYDSTVQRYESQIKFDEDQHKKELEDRKELVIEYEHKISKLELEYSLALADLQKKKFKRQEKLLEIIRTDPTTLAEEIESRFGFEYVK